MITPELLVDIRSRFAHVDACPFQGPRVFFVSRFRLGQRGRGNACFSSSILARRSSHTWLAMAPYTHPMEFSG